MPTRNCDKKKPKSTKIYKPSKGSIKNIYFCGIFHSPPPPPPPDLVENDNCFN